MRIIDKTGPLNNPADRDHCIQYMVAVPLIFGRLTAADYEDDVASAIRGSMRCATRWLFRENEQYTKDYFDPELRYIGNCRAGVLQGWQQHRPRGYRFPDWSPANAGAKASRCWLRNSSPASSRNWQNAVGGAERAVQRSGAAGRNGSRRLHGIACTLGSFCTSHCGYHIAPARQCRRWPNPAIATGCLRC